jgi:hypothetical protein
MSQRRGREDGRPRAHPRTGDPQAIRTAADVRRLVSEQITELTTNPDLDPVRKAGRLAQLARVALRAIEVATLEARVEAVEAALRLRKDDQTRKEMSP